MNEDQTIRIVLHAPTAAALKRARSNAGNLQAAQPRPLVRIVVNAEAVAAALDEPSPAADAITLVCRNTLNKLGRSAPAPLAILEEGAVLGLARMQREGWSYIRA
ncbi:hypothetical protein [Ramlibacter sp.]|uniref:hypothetical protein n=1 Tax=Ramlibacter sp. TaxID=1917967 RepID=UPI002CCDBAD3|nr:hypothetical protein [Ramlibacter sp.]HWI83720.1 hypothetical protein [Ramlibacter sp.]